MGGREIDRESDQPTGSCSFYSKPSNNDCTLYKSGCGNSGMCCGPDFRQEDLKFQVKRSWEINRNMKMPLAKVAPLGVLPEKLQYRRCSNQDLCIACRQFQRCQVRHGHGLREGQGAPRARGRCRQPRRGQGGSAHPLRVQPASCPVLPYFLLLRVI